jgi:3-hydroxyacyl-[acyl-carrier-protein] dehydratase
MHFTFVDRVLEFEPGVKITTLKCLSLGEEYLADHFPRFPVMPGVLMVQAMTEAASLLIRATEGFAHSMVTLKEARNIRFADFVQPGRALTVTAELLRIEPRDVEFKTQGVLEDRVAVSARLVLERYNLADTRAELAATDAYLKEHFQAQLAMVYRPSTEVAAAAGSAMISPHDGISPHAGSEKREGLTDAARR